MPVPGDDDNERLTPTIPPPPMIESPSGARTRRVIAVGGGRGGVGKTLLTVNLGVYFAQLGREVVVCDTDPFGSNLHGVLGLETPPLVTSEALEEGKAKPVSTIVPGLRLLPTAYDPMTATPIRPNRGSHWARQIEKLDVDYVLLNLGASTTASTLDLFLQADVGICVTAPEPLAIETTYRFCRALYLRVLRRALTKERFKLRLVERVIAALPPLAPPPAIVAEIKRYDDGVAKVAAEEMLRVAAHLVVGQTRLRSDLDLGMSMSVIAERFLGISLDNLGHIEHDDAVWLTVRRRQPLLIDSPTSKSARNIERVARRILALLAAQSTRGGALPPRAPVTQQRAAALPATLYEVLGVPRTAADDEIRRAVKRQREIFREGSLPLCSVVAPEVLRQVQARIEEAHDTLLDPVRRRAYDLSTFPDDTPATVVPQRSSNAAQMAELAMLQAELAREINAETQFSGALLRKVRESQGIEITEIAQRTKINITHLHAIENESFGDLPALVYVQGFVQQIAKFLKLDPAQVAKTYTRRLRDLSLGRARSSG
ncbi:helix-turn-helix domain-containing protein [Polyangium mundeleinium]|uniref:Helix-turn-helix domain-containing protein n=1 Tax=Polyangium mundeleinium TaxID=2995306 RepID=A0ABT5F5J2_9BACT|nr:helix-turn-helix domain-containing protein [Polyangium mundeleinium]MDC0749221.1 helix-turn-helix domain-containing protein [Polyangium mundeleinium]